MAAKVNSVPLFKRMAILTTHQKKRGSIIHITVATMTVLAVGAGSPQRGYAQAVLPEIKVHGQSGEGYAVQQSVTATRTDTALRDIPQAISVVTHSQMQDQAAQSLQEALRYVPGVGFAQGEGNRETPILRGIATTGDFFIDGVRDDVQYYRDLYNIEQVEVFRGPNAMIFGRGATGGLINRVTKVPSWTPGYGASLTLGSNENRRATFDINQPVNSDVAIRVNAMNENSGSYRSGVALKRMGVNPTLSWRAGTSTIVTLGYEYFKDDRVADRGISSYRGVPVQTSRSTFFGNAEGSPTGTELNAATAFIEHTFESGAVLRNRLRWADQDKSYQNVFPGAVNASGSQVAISAYNNATSRTNAFNQTDLIFPIVAGAFKHKLLIGTEFAQQETSNARLSGFFPSDATSVNVPVSNPVTFAPVTYRQAVADADNAGKAKIAAVYVQDQIELTSRLQMIAGIRYDKFKVDFKNNRNGQAFNTNDGFLSPRIGAVYRLLEPVSLYANYSIANQPRAGDQLASLALTNAALDPEKFKNYELGVKWDVAKEVAATAAIYRLDRSNVVVLDPSDSTSTRTMLGAGQRSEGIELSLSGSLTSAWSVAGAYSYTDAKFVADTSATLRAGGRVAQVPKHTLSLWNRYELTPTIGVGVGVIYRGKSFAANEQIITAAAPTPNVELQGYTRADAALFLKINKNLQAQINIENLFDRKYYLFANSNTNITPGSPRAVRAEIIAKF